MEGRRRRHEAEERARWEQARWIAAVLLAPYAAKGRSIKPKDIARFPWDEGPAKKKERPVALWEKWDEEMKKKYG